MTKGVTAREGGITTDSLEMSGLLSEGAVHLLRGAWPCAGGKTTEQIRV